MNGRKKIKKEKIFLKLLKTKLLGLRTETETENLDYDCELSATFAPLSLKKGHRPLT